jgi:hypothetical protein
MTRKWATLCMRQLNGPPWPPHRAAVGLKPLHQVKASALSRSESETNPCKDACIMNLENKTNTTQSKAKYDRHEPYDVIEDPTKTSQGFPPPCKWTKTSGVKLRRGRGAGDQECVCLRKEKVLRTFLNLFTHSTTQYCILWPFLTGWTWMDVGSARERGKDDVVKPDPSFHSFLNGLFLLLLTFT